MFNCQDCRNQSKTDRMNELRNARKFSFRARAYSIHYLCLWLSRLQKSVKDWYYERSWGMPGSFNSVLQLLALLMFVIVKRLQKSVKDWYNERSWEMPGSFHSVLEILVFYLSGLYKSKLIDWLTDWMEEGRKKGRNTSIQTKDWTNEWDTYYTT